MKRLILDADGTLFCYNHSSTLDDLMKPGYFANLDTYQHVVDAIKMIYENHPKIKLVLCSKVLNDTYIIQDKNKAIDKHLPFIQERIYVPYHQSKVDYLGNITNDDYLLDDYSENLREFENAGGKAIKLLNGKNGKHGTWKGPFVHEGYPAWMIYEHLIKIIKGEE